jgi:hypothetical protein
MNGKLGKPYKFFYSARNYVSGLVDIIALVKNPDGTTNGTYSLSELTGSLFLGTYYFDFPTTQNDPEGEYSVIIYEQTSGHREIAKVSMNLPVDGSDYIADPEIFGTLSENIVTGAIQEDPELIGAIGEIQLTGKLIESTLSAIMQSEQIVAKILDEILIGKLSECNQ